MSRAPWHERPGVLAAASALGIAALMALAFSVVTMSDQSTHPVVVQTPQAQTPTPEAQTPTPSPTPQAQTPLAETPPPALPAAPPSSATHFADGPTVEMMVRPTPPAPAPFRLPEWLQRLLHPGPG
ncbi:hypothetical protein MMAD_13780 [Mycolicibacterium madagascariense]|uniref:Uncharacterized protein n=1 Tax=Mycolicibacterium madagascariense TaxID=212765 RepID=A0A7I7XDN3_9MYCO|nr:hypothetical protein MMAD_13780 [Mycolicibacterium madagascariense]